MYSASLIKESFLLLKRALEEEEKGSLLVKEGYAVRMAKQLERCNRELLYLKRECDGALVVQEIDDFV